VAINRSFLTTTISKSSDDLSNKIAMTRFQSTNENVWKTLNKNDFRLFSTTTNENKNVNNDQTTKNNSTTTNSNSTNSNSSTTSTTTSTTESKSNDRKFINVTFIDKSGKRIEVKAPLGMNMLEVAHKNDIDLEGFILIFFQFWKFHTNYFIIFYVCLFFVYSCLFVFFLNDYDFKILGACECSLACSTCHVILEPKYYKSLAEPSDEENDMLDLAFGLTET